MDYFFSPAGRITAPLASGACGIHRKEELLHPVACRHSGRGRLRYVRMITGMTSSAPTPLRQLIENRLSQLTAETESLFAEARERARRETADQLNQAVRRIRQAASLEELTATLTDAAGGFASGAMLFRIEENAAKSVEIEIPLETAAALRGAIDTR